MQRCGFASHILAATAPSVRRGVKLSTSQELIDFFGGVVVVVVALNHVSETVSVEMS